MGPTWSQRRSNSMQLTTSFISRKTYAHAPLSIFIHVKLSLSPSGPLLVLKSSITHPLVFQDHWRPCSLSTGEYDVPSSVARGSHLISLQINLGESCNSPSELYYVQYTSSNCHQFISPLLISFFKKWCIWERIFILTEIVKVACLLRIFTIMCL